MSSPNTSPAPDNPSSTLSLQAPHLATLAGRAYRCKCGVPVFFRNSECLACGTPLGYDPEQARLLSLMPGQATDTWVVWQPEQVADSDAVAEPVQPQGDTNNILPPPARAYTRCLNLQTPAACNWLVPVDGPLEADGTGPALLCRACRLNRIIPDLNDPEHPDNGLLWGRVELAKRRLVSALLALGLPVASRITEDTERGMMFDFLRSPDNGPHVMTGHNTGLITLNLQEADDAVREAVRKAMREPYRTLLGHFRHEVGHYYWDRLVSGTSWMDGFHELFGDENKDYLASLRQNYEEGPAAEWWLTYVSAYASTHPWEDWAECWAHYLHMRDTIDTALSFGMVAESAHLEFTPYTIDALYKPDHPDAQNFLDFLNDWTRLTTMLNEMSRSMGQPDFYPFVLPLTVVAKLHFIHLLVTSASWLPEDPGVVRAAQEEIDQQIDSQTTPATQANETQDQSQAQTGVDQNQAQSRPAQAPDPVQGAADLSYNETVQNT
ncbi:MAG: putative zinc-binding metallopeptidase [Pseudomonadota bacterium]